MLFIASALLASVVAPPPGYTFERVTTTHLARATKIETDSYPADEAADEAKLSMRMQEAPDYFWGAFDADGTLQGFVCGTLTTAEQLTDESMSEHEPAGTTLCIHSVVVEESLRRRGIALWMLSEYMQEAATLQHPTRVLLICKEQLVGLYERAGFENLGPSDVVHGADPWLLMGTSFDVDVVE